MSTQAKKRTTEEILAAWNAPGSAGFWNWLQDVQPRILSAQNRFITFEPEPWQREIIDGELQANEAGEFAHSLCLLVTPRRHSKTTLHALLVLWLATSRKNWTFQVIGNSEGHVRRVPMRMLTRIIANTPALSQLIPEKHRDLFELRVPSMGNTIQAIRGTLAQAFGDKLNLLWACDFHACPDLAPWDAFQAALLDSEGTICLIDSNTDGEGGHVHRLEQQAEEDAAFFSYRVEYKDFDHYLEAAPNWINRDNAKRLQKTTLPGAFDRDILGKRGCGVDALFDPKHILAAQERYHLPLKASELPDLFHGRRYLVGGGLDRAYGFSLHGDQTVWTSVAKVAGEDEEAEYWVLNQKNISFSSGKGIKKAIAADHEEHNLENCCIEMYNSQDIAAWCQDSKIPAEIIHTTATNQVPAFTELHRIVAEGRLHFPEELNKLAEEMKVFTYDTSGKQPRFGAAPGFHDDRVYSLCWAIWSLRDQEMQTYELRSVVCNSSSKFAKHCYLRTGSLQLPCAEFCEAHKRVDQMHLQFMRRRVDQEMTLPEFYKRKVKLTGGKTYQGI